MTDRDTLAAAALTGLLAGPGGKTAEQWALHAYSLADAMIRERERNGVVSGCEAPTLTDAEREAVDNVAAFLFGLADTSVQAGTGEKLRRHAATLRSLLERLK